MRRNKTLTESSSLLEGTEVLDNVVKNVKVLGLYSKNNRVYPQSTMQAALAKYEGSLVNLDHKPNEHRSVMDRFGQIVNVRLEENGIYGDLVFNPAHPYAPAFKYFVDYQPDALGISHAAICKTKMERDGTELVQEIVELESCDIVANAATNKNIFESYNQILESVMKKKTEAELVLPGPKVHVPEAMADDKNLPHVSEDCDKDMAEAVGAIVGGSMSHEEKVKNVLGLFKTKFEEKDKKEEAASNAIPVDEAKDDDKDDDKKHEEKDMDDDKKHEEKDADDEKKKAEESVRKSVDVGLKLLLEELDLYRTKDKQVKLQEKIVAFCADAGLDKKLVTEAFIDVLSSVPETKWKALCEDRKSVSFTRKSPVSFSGDIASGHKELTVDELVKKLRS
jgi:uncharacterized protein (UPF0147 family)